MAANGVRIWFDYISGVNCISNPCLSECSDFISLGNLGHLQTAASYSNTVNTYYFTALDAVYNYNVSDLNMSQNGAYNPYLWGIFIDSTQIDGSNASFVGSANRRLPSDSSYINIYFGGVGKGISFALSTAYASGGYALMKANHMIEMTQVTSISMSVSELPLYTTNLQICVDDGDCDCDGFNICEEFTETDHCKATIRGKDWDGNDVQETVDLNFHNSNTFTVNLGSQFAALTNVSLFNDSNVYMGDGVITCQGYYIPLLECGWSVFEGLLDCAFGQYLSCVTNFLQALNIALPSPRNVGTFLFSTCDKYASFNPDLDFMAVSADIVENTSASIMNFFYPQLVFTISAGFEGVNTCEDCCCESYNETSSSGGNGSLIINGQSQGGGEGGESSGSSDECICEWLEEIKSTLEGKLTMINDSLVAIKNAIQALRLECNTTVSPTPITVEPCNPNVTVSAPSVTVNPQITVTPCEPNITVNPSSVEIDLSGVETAISGLGSSISSSNDGLMCNDESLACIVKAALNRTDIVNGQSVTKSITETINEKDISTYNETIVEPCNYTYTRFASHDIDND